MAPLSVGSGGTRLTRVAVQAGQPPQTRSRLVDLSVVTGPVPPPAALTRLAELSVSAGPADTSAPRTRLSGVSLLTSYAAPTAGTTRLSRVAVITGPLYQAPAALPCVFYLSDDGSYRPYQVLTLDDFPWN